MLTDETIYSPLANAFATQCVHWAQARTSSVEAIDCAGTAARLLVEAEAAGHICLLPENLPPQCATLLATSGICTTAGKTTLSGSGVETAPLVQDDDGRLYLWRNFDLERRLAVALLALRSPGGPALPLDALSSQVQAVLHELFSGSESERQKIAAIMALTGRCALISGGPGTGKTTTIARILHCLLAENPAARIAIAAPTGKATARLQDSLLQYQKHGASASQPLSLPKAQTLHRLLGVSSQRAAARFHTLNQLAIDVLVIDEASMLDLQLAVQVLEALPASARLLLLGDQYQLAAVEAGAVFAELYTASGFDDSGWSALKAIFADEISPELQPAPHMQPLLPNMAISLTHNYRFALDSSLGKLTAAVRDSEVDVALNCFDNQQDSCPLLYDESSTSLSATAIKRLQQGCSTYIAIVRQSLAEGFDEARLLPLFVAFERFRILCAQRQSKRGSLYINSIVDTYARATIAGNKPESVTPWYAGRPIIIAQNDYDNQLFNGDVGLCLPDGANRDELRVYFSADSATTSQQGYRSIAVEQLPAYEAAWATTVHKAQGSEFDEVAVILPAGDSPLLTRELLYTAITRARQRLQVYSSRQKIEQCMRNNTRRKNGLAARLNECMQRHS